VGYFGPEASQYTKSRMLHKTITLQLDKSRSPRDNYGRLLAYLLIDGKNYNRQIVADGYAYADPRFPHPQLKDFKAVQEQAKAAGVGLWHGVQDKDLPYYYQGKLKLGTR
jgi:micrococcal nuclease